MIAGVILAAGKGSRFGLKDGNKVAIDFHGSSPVTRAAETMSKVVDKVFVVIGHKAQSVKQQLKDIDVTYVVQEEQNGTGHAFSVALDHIDQETYASVIVGNGDHMMFYTPEILKSVLDIHIREKAAATCITSTHPDVQDFGFGRIVRTKDGAFERIIEQKDADPSELKIQEFNSGLAIFDCTFAHKAIQNLSTTNVAGELYITDLFGIGFQNNEKVIAVTIDFQYVGIGINSPDDYQRSLSLFQEKTRTHS